MPTAYDQVIQSSTAQERLYQHYHDGAGLYKLWGSPGSVLSAMLWGWDRADHPTQIHYAWDLKQAPSINEAINNLVRAEWGICGYYVHVFEKPPRRMP